MKKAIKIIICIVLVVLILLFSITSCSKINYVTNYALNGLNEGISNVKDGSWLNNDNGINTEINDTGFVPGTYGGIEFKTVDDLINYYVTVYNATKSQTKEYKNKNNEISELYSFLGTELLSINSILVDGKDNNIINNLVPGVVKGLFQENASGLPPTDSRSLTDDPWAKSLFTADDVDTCTVEDNGDGTITVVIKPKSGVMSLRGKDSQGKFFNVLGNVAETVESISILSWASGTTAENCVVKYENGLGTIKIDTASGKIVEADYHMGVTVDIRHASVTVIKDKSALLDISYDQHFPADDKYVFDTLGLTPVS